MITATGLGSGLDVGSLVTQLVAAERAGSDLQLDRQNAKLNAKFSALGSLKGVLATFQSSLGALNTLGNFSKNSATSSAATEVAITATSAATPNNYAVNVTQLAEAHGLASSAFADSDTTQLGTGTLTIRFGTTDYNAGTDTYNGFVLNGDSGVATIDITNSNNTLEGIMQAINAAEAGVNASIVNDGAGYRLLLSSKTTGLENSIEISVNDDDLDDADTAGLSRFAFNAAATNLEQTSAAADALFSVNGLAVSSPTNNVDAAITGVTLSLKKVTTSTVNLAVKSDYAAVTSGANAFVSGFNQFINTVNILSAYNAEKNLPAPLVGDFTLRSISSQIDSILHNAVPGLAGVFSSLSEIGITTTKTGALQLDSAKLTAALAEDPAQVAKIFSAVAAPTDADISYHTATSATVVGTYAVEITTLASAGNYASAAVLPDFGMGGTVTIDANNDNLTLEIDGVTMSEITLTAGVYASGSALAGEIQAQINGEAALRAAGVSVTVAYDSGSNGFTVTSNSLGSTSTVNVLGIDTNTAATLGFSVAAGVDGTDVAGTIGGVAAVGAGNVLTGATGTDTEGLALVIDGTTTGSRGDVNFTRGMANQLSLLLGQFLDAEGALEDRIGSYQDRIDEVATRRAEMELRWKVVQERYTAKFNALDSLLSSLQSTSSYMENQFKNLLKPYTGNNS